MFVLNPYSVIFFDSHQISFQVDFPEGLAERFDAANVVVRDVNDYRTEFHRYFDVEKKMDPAAVDLAAKSDLLRLEVVFLEGGIYQDTDARVVTPFDEFGEVFRWPFVVFEIGSYNNICNCVFGFQQNSEFLNKAIDVGWDNCKNRNSCHYWSDTLTDVALKWQDPVLNWISHKHIIHSESEPIAVTYHSMDATWLENFQNRFERIQNRRKKFKISKVITNV
jgi:hypothetical protein